MKKRCSYILWVGVGNTPFILLWIIKYRSNQGEWQQFVRPNHFVKDIEFITDLTLYPTKLSNHTTHAPLKWLQGRSGQWHPPMASSLEHLFYYQFLKLFLLACLISSARYAVDIQRSFGSVELPKGSPSESKRPLFRRAPPPPKPNNNPRGKIGAPPEDHPFPPPPPPPPYLLNRGRMRPFPPFPMMPGFNPWCCNFANDESLYTISDSCSIHTNYHITKYN